MSARTPSEPPPAAGKRAPGPGKPLLAGWRGRAVAASIALSAAGYLAVALWSGWREVAHAVALVGAAGVGAALALSLVNYGLRFLRWQSYLRALGHAVPWRPSLRIYVGGFALTTTPGKAGEAVRGVLLKPWGVPYPDSLAAFVSERLSDLLAVLLLTLFGLATYPSARPMVAVGAAILAGALIVLASARLLGALRAALQRRLALGAGARGDLRDGERAGTRGGRLGGLLLHGFDVLLQARRCHAPGLLIRAALLSAVAWAAEAWAFDLILRWMGFDVPLQFAVFVYAISMLAGALSMMPGGLGGAEGAMVALLVWKGVPTPDAVAATVLIRLATLWFAVALGAVAMAARTPDAHGA